MRPLRRRPIDFAVSAVIVVALVVVAVFAWHASSARRTTLSPATAAPTTPPYPDRTPARLVPRWHAASTATRSPQVTDTVVLTGDDGAVVAHDPHTGRELWRYHRDIPLCALLAAWSPSTPTALAAYRNSRGCGEITALDADLGKRRATRSSDADHAITLQSDGGYVLGVGATRLETWGSNLVRGIEYGRVDAPVKPDRGPRTGTGCEFSSGMTSGDRVAVIEHCDGDPGFRLTVLGAVLDKDEKITLYGSSVITSGTAFAAPTIVAMSESAIAVYDGGENSPEPAPPTIRVFNSDGADTARQPVPGPRTPPTATTSVTSDGLTSVWTGQATVVLDGDSLRPRYTVPHTRGPGIVVGGQMMVPDDRGYVVVDPATGRRVGELAVPRASNGKAAESTPINPASLGDVILEQVGDTVTAYGP